MTRIRKVESICAVIAALLSASGAAAGPSGDVMSRLAPALGNVIVSTHPDGRKARLWLQRGGAYTAQSRAGDRSGGTWKVKGEKLCLSQRNPIPIPIAYCKPIPAEAAGRPWRDTEVNGDQVVNLIACGSGANARK